ncbi:unnamed protein product [Bursaphelenchus xylophilus]|uniref:long-chain-fatty-acid--CoA ligase n=1 Tax=Bursaphelenchus xylophilus TaxID=6326 RepID=A0A1I7RTD5_BURXY|nr:unnamed protein product [Bursaphelenchus xylophilus]CAG9122492.1 unnamed protein product [Bursaphelenchus xylophilus]
MNISEAVRKSFRRSFRTKSRFPVVQEYSRLLPGEERIRENVLVEAPITRPQDPEVKIISDLLTRGKRLSNDGKCYGTLDENRNIIWSKYSEVIEMVEAIGSGLIELGIEASQETKIGVIGKNSKEYAMVGHVCSAYSMVMVPLYHNYKFQEIQQIVAKCSIHVLFCDSVELAEKFKDDANIKHLIILNHIDDIVLGDDSKIISWPSLLEKGRSSPHSPLPAQPSDIYMICHTSGTTGYPKGAMISHHAILTAMTGTYINWFSEANKLTLSPSDVYISFLSLAHVYEQVMEAILLFSGGQIGFYSGDITRLLDDIQSYRPTVVAFVPRVLEKFKQKIEAGLKTKPIFVQKLISLAIKKKTEMLNKKVLSYKTFADTLLRPIHKIFGGKLRLIITGGAPISSDLKTFSRVIYGCPLLEGYGQTECVAAGTLSLVGDTEAGHVGGPSAWSQIKLVSVPEMSYDASDDKGEICFRGPALMSGYIGEPELTEQTIDKEGWLHTGDIGCWLPNGALKIIDRKKNFFKLAQGDFVSPERVEQIYAKHPAVTQIFVDGKGTEAFLVAIIVVDEGSIKKIAEDLGTDPSNLNNNVIRSKILSDLRELGREGGLSSLEQIQNLHLVSEEFGLENGLLTPTLKMKRNELRAKYQDVISNLYQQSLLQQ